ncbi:methylenetetrahydrofolate reductase [Methanohalophilus sp.]|uniref:methylenetetrahydrofolate reductase n=1 Tax=Methanohalophilus sp. TaxID=1966352 RepID=UPI00262F1945|nr:methylenetetrahydrofolate reductase [Methanohalophilus sp.]MDK2892535.1 methylenetetrahydrofolate reductase [Methanohalophilus sp.]
MSSTFNDALKSDRFIVTSEVSPPKGTDVSAVLEDADLLRRWVDAVNVTDNQRAVMRMSPIAVAKLLMDAGHEVIMQLTCRDRNRLALQSDLLAASALGIRNICVMTGDYPTKGDHPGSKPVYDLDAVQLLQAVRRLEHGMDMAGNSLESTPTFVKGAVCNTDPDNSMQLMKLEKKARVGLDFLQTQAVYDVGRFEEFLESISHLEVPVLAGMIPLRSVKMAHFMNKNIPGIRVEDELILRLESSEDPAIEGALICAEHIRELKKICKGIHLMSIGNNRSIPAILKQGGLSEKI